MSEAFHKHKDVFLLTAVSALLIFYKLGEKSLTTWDEILYAQMAKEMLIRGDWLTPYLNHIPWFDKPPFYTGLTAFFYSFFGINEVSARLLSALSGVATVVVTYLFSRKMFSRTEAIVASVVLLSSLHFLNHARLAMTDVTLTFFITLSLYFFCLGFENSKYYLAMGFAISAALLTKGIAGGVVYFIIGLTLFFSKRLHIFKNRYFLTGVLISILIPMSWFLYEYARFGEALTDLMLKGHLARIGQVVDDHYGSWLSYVNVIFYKGKLWGGAALACFGFFLIRELFSPKKDFRFVLLLSWAFCVLVLFSLSKTKLHWYIMPIYPPLFMLFATAVCQLRHIIPTISVIPAKAGIYIIPVFSMVFLLYYQISRPNKFNENTNALAKRAALHLKMLKKPGERVFVVGPLEQRVFLFYADVVTENGDPLTVAHPPSGWVVAYQSDEFLKEYLDPRYALRDEIEGVKFFYR